LFPEEAAIFANTNATMFLKLDLSSSQKSLVGGAWRRRNKTINSDEKTRNK
tara:strand:- start:433 stop:585 length:153 start_codon:yes stop_codon:yes gene_type:complete